MNIKYLLLVMFCFLSTHPFIYWEDFSKKEQNEIIQDKIANKDVNNLAKGNFKIRDNDQTKILLDTLSKLPSDIKYKAMYFNLFNQVCEKADGALSEMLGNPCQSILLSDTEYVIFYLKNKPSLMKTYAQILGVEFFFKEDGTSDLKYNFTEFKKIVNKRLCDEPEYKSFLSSFYKEIELSMDNMK